jgi:hypothetical protein
MNKGKNIEIFKPCNKLGWCPYGPLIENFPLKEKPDKISCSIFGHDCPAFTMAEGFVDDKNH